MKSKEVRQAVEERIRAEPGIVDMMFLDPEYKQRVIESEAQAEKNGACGGIMPFVNDGVWQSLDRDVCIVIIIRSSELILDNTGIVYIVDQKGQKIGEYLTPKRREEVKKERPDAAFLSEDFCLYSDLNLEGEPYFVIAPIPFPTIENIPGVKDVVSGSISTMSDDFIRREMNHMGPNRWSHLVGFNYSEEVEKTEEEKKRLRVVRPPLYSPRGSSSP